MGLTITWYGNVLSAYYSQQSDRLVASLAIKGNDSVMNRKAFILSGIGLWTIANLAEAEEITQQPESAKIPLKVGHVFLYVDSCLTIG